MAAVVNGHACATQWYYILRLLYAMPKESTRAAARCFQRRFDGAEKRKHDRSQYLFFFFKRQDRIITVCTTVLLENKRKILRAWRLWVNIEYTLCMLQFDYRRYMAYALVDVAKNENRKHVLRRIHLMSVVLRRGGKKEKINNFQSIDKIRVCNNRKLRFTTTIVR